MTTTPPVLYLAATIRGKLVDGAPVFDVLDEELRPDTDAGHRPYGVTSVETKWDRIRVHHAQLDAIATCPPAADESYGAADITAHTSAGLSYVDVFMRRAGVLITPANACLPGSNVWLLGHGWPTP